MSSRRHQNPDGDQSKSLPWHNALPPWIRSDPAYLKLGQGFRMTLQTIANKCDAPPETGPQTLLVCFGGDQLYEACGCDRRTFQRHLRRLKGLGLVVELSHGSGRQTSVYGIPGQRGELDGYQAQARRCGSRPRGWWERADTTRLRQQLADGPPPEVKSKTKLLERQSAALAEGRNTSLEDGQDAAAGAAKCHGRGGKMPRQGRQNAALPSSLPSSRTSALNPPPKNGKMQVCLHDDDDGSSQTPDHPEGEPVDELSLCLLRELPDEANATMVMMALQNRGVHGGRAVTLANEALCTPILIRPVLARFHEQHVKRRIRNPGAYLGNLVDNAIIAVHEARDQQRRAVIAKERSRLDAVEAGTGDPDASVC